MNSLKSCENSMINKYGLLESDLEYIFGAVKKYSQVEQLVLFGSRAMGNYKKGSDVDLAIIGAQVSPEILANIIDDLNEESPMPYFFDVLDYHAIESDALRNHIDTQGIIIYQIQGH